MAEIAESAAAEGEKGTKVRVRVRVRVADSAAAEGEKGPKVRVRVGLG